MGKSLVEKKGQIGNGLPFAFLKGKRNCKLLIGGKFMEIKSFKIDCSMWTNKMNILVFTVDEYVCPTETILKEENGSSYVYGESEGFVTYGFIHDNKRWSSRASIFNGMFGKRVIDNVVIETKNGRYSAAMTVDSVLPYLPKGYYILEQVETDSKGKIAEVSYHITNSKHEKENQYWFGNVIYEEGGRRYIRNRIYP